MFSQHPYLPTTRHRAGGGGGIQLGKAVHSPTPALGLVSFGISNDELHSFTAVLRVVVTAGLGEALTSLSPTTPTGIVANILLLYLRFACRVTGDGYLTPIWEVND